MMSRILALTFVTSVTLGAAACGGAIEQPTDDNAPAPASTLKSANADVTPFGVWDLVSLDRDGAGPTEVHDVLQLDLKSDGTVTARRCLKQYFETVSASVRCGDEASYDCFYGTLTREADAWRVNLPDVPISDSRDERTIETVQAGETIKIRYILPKSSAGTFQRAEDEVVRSSSSSYTVGNCKANGGG